MEIKYYTEEQVKLIATRFARQSRSMHDVTSNDTIESFDNWFPTFDVGKLYIIESGTNTIEETDLLGLKRLFDNPDNYETQSDVDR